MVHTILITSLISIMIFFSAAITPIAFKKLPSDVLQVFLRAVFPVLFSVGLIISGIFTIVLGVKGEPFLASLGFLVTIGFAVNKFWLTKKINFFKDQSESGIDAAEKKFKLFHFISVSIYLLQIILMIFILASDSIKA